MTIIIVEDNSYTAEDMLLELKCAFSNGEDIQYKEAANFYQAEDRIKAHQNDRKCILIMDVNMPYNGLSKDDLSEEEMKETNGGMLTGWVWLKKHVLAIEDYSSLRVIIYSAFTDDLRASPSFQNHPNQKQILLISKNEDGLDTLNETVRKIYKSIKK